MTIATVFLSAKGRIGRGDFWTGWLLLFVVSAVLGLFGLIGHLLAVLVVYPQVCLFAKRLHDAGRSGWWTLLPLGLSTAAALVAGLIQGLQAAGAAESADPLVGLGGGLVVTGCAIAAVVLFLRAALERGEPGDNRYGPPPLAVLARFGARRAAA